jgi:superfamily I DNA/RNA helicase/mRNA-degrading endonuclease RelE of RelBE toxin-antitoxin system
MATVTFSSTFSKVDGLDSQIVDFIRKLQQHPEDPGLNLKKPKGAKDKNVRTARINKQYRAVLFDLSGSTGRHFVLVDILNHDDAYKKAERLRLETNPINGVAVLREEATVEPEVEGSLAKARAAEEQALKQAAAEASAGSTNEYGPVDDNISADELHTTEPAEPEPDTPSPAAEIPATPVRTPREMLAASGITVEDIRDRLSVPQSAIDIAVNVSDVELVDQALIAHQVGERDRDMLLNVFAADNLAEVLEEFQLDEKPVTETGADEATDDSLISSLEHPAARSRFRTLAEGTSDAQLLEILDQISFNDWRIFLHESQQPLVDAQFRGAGRVIGGAGTGKTVVAVHRANNLATNWGKIPELCSDSPRILLTTYTRALSDSLKSLMNLLNPSYPEAATIGTPGMWIAGIDSVIHTVLGRAQSTEIRAAMLTGLGMDGLPNDLAGLEGRAEDRLWQEAVALAKTNLAPEKANAEFLSQEYSTIILGAGITEQSVYLRTKRRGRGTSLNRSERKDVWKIVEIFHRKCLGAGRLTWPALAIIAAEILTNRITNHGGRSLFDHVVIDEAQDFHAAHWRFLRAAVAPGRNDIFLAEDPHQRIYGQHLVLSHYGIVTKGRASRRLTRNYRTTAETLRYALNILNGVEWKDAEDSTDKTSGTRSLRHGPAPLLVPVDTDAEQLNAIVIQIDSWKQEVAERAADNDVESKIHVGVLARSKNQARSLTTMLSAADLDVTDSRQATVAADHEVAVMTMHSAKGLEFTHVILLGVDAATMPQQFRMRGLAVAEKEDILQRERALLYVAASRARDALMVTFLGQPSQILPDLQNYSNQ